jgi:DNA-directed RNA polymerase subunit RPC12/RpoP
MPARQLELLQKPPRRSPRVLMHVCDAGDDVVQFRCSTCGCRSKWLTGMSVTEAKRGLPCPKCNGE